MRARLNQRLSSLLGLELSTAEPVSDESAGLAAAGAPGQDEPGEREEKHDEEFEFRLFSTSATTAAPAKVVLDASDDEDADLGRGGFTVATRPVEYYVAGEPTAEQLERYRYSAVTGEDILLGARRRAWGLERPWRVVRIALPVKGAKSSKTKTTPAAARPGDEVDLAEKRKRPGKKRRIAMRVKAKAEKERREAEEKHKQSKEEHLLEKKKRLNREKKLKRRAKEREKKLATKGQDGTAPESEPVDSGSDAGSGD